MSIFITGDLHGSHGVRRLGTRYFDADNLTKDDFVIICGDFGLVWGFEGGDWYKENQYWLDWLDSKSFTTLFVDGNHENFEVLNGYPVEIWHGGKVHRVRNSVLHLMRGQVFDIEGKTFFSMGGAYSCDKEWRTPGLSWWEEEVPNSFEREEAIDILAAHGNRVDYVLTHCAPSGILDVLPLGSLRHPDDEYNEFLQANIADKVEFKQWFFGHYHEDQAVSDRYQLLYGGIYDLDRGELLPARKKGKKKAMYTFQEIADDLGVDVKLVDAAADHMLSGQTVALAEDGSSLVYSCDVPQFRAYFKQIGVIDDE